MAKKNKEEVVVEVENTKLESIGEEKKSFLDSAKQIWQTKNKLITGILGGLLLLVLLAIAYKWYKGNQNEKGEIAGFTNEISALGLFAQDKIGNDTINALLNGGQFADDAINGFLSVIKKNSGSDAANRAHLFAGRLLMSQAQQNTDSVKGQADFKKAFDYLKKFDAGEAYQLKIVQNILLGHCSAEMNKTKEAAEYYEAATNVNEKDETLTGFALYNAARFARLNNDKKAALKFYERLNKDYPLSNPEWKGEAERAIESLK